MATVGTRITGRMYVPPIEPMFEIVMVAPARSSVGSLPSMPDFCMRLSSIAISMIVLSCTFLTLGTSRPSLVSMAKPMLCAPLIVSWLQSSFTWLLIVGYWRRAREVAFMKNGRNDRLIPLSAAMGLSWFLRSARRFNVISSQYVKWGTMLAAFMLLTIAFWIPRMGNTWSAALAKIGVGAAIGVGVGAAAAGAGTAAVGAAVTGTDATAPPVFIPSMYATTSSFSTLPSLPVPFTFLMSIPLSFAMRLTAGVANLRPSKLSRSCPGCSAATGAGWASAAGGALGVSAASEGASSPVASACVSISTSGKWTFAISPTP
eukprot:comp21122_c0_seq1/m.28548 comp21122_c0_seq1/g.28548  ORF comp21122_c0_seq1/g.28548 comp21122_c0_seq1/m.28548 type:complete len:318 (+) comp21122_c0_seq1:235-1188(+)